MRMWTWTIRKISRASRKYSIPARAQSSENIMLGVLLTGISSAFNEISFSIGKRQVNDGAESYYTFGFLIQFFSALFICAAGFLFNDLVFSPASFPTFGLQIGRAHV